MVLHANLHANHCRLSCTAWIRQRRLQTSLHCLIAEAGAVLWGDVLLIKRFISQCRRTCNTAIAYLLVIGIAERRPLSMAVTVFAFVTYVHFVSTPLPWVSPPGVIWIGHYLGFIGGVIAALGMFREDPK